MKKSKPIRMCLSCRSRYPQKSLLRLQQQGKDLIAYSGRGRSFYLCESCCQNEKKVKGLAKRFKQDKTAFSELLETLKNSFNVCDTSHFIKGVNE
jgi:predicted RNA-binding protein YlxR (DUF448 family)